MNYPGTELPAWEYRENALVGADQTHRVALFPTQFLEQFDWGNPEFYIENSLVSRPMIYGLLGSEPSQGTDVWVRRAYRAAREGLPFAADMFRVLGVDTFLQRDDFIPVIDFSSPESRALQLDDAHARHAPSRARRDAGACRRAAAPVSSQWRAAADLRRHASGDRHGSDVHRRLSRRCDGDGSR